MRINAEGQLIVFFASRYSSDGENQKSEDGDGRSPIIDDDADDDDKDGNCDEVGCK